MNIFVPDSEENIPNPYISILFRTTTFQYALNSKLIFNFVINEVESNTAHQFLHRRILRVLSTLSF